MRQTPSHISQTVFARVTGSQLFLLGTGIGVPIALAIVAGLWLLRAPDVDIDAIVVVPAPAPASPSPGCAGLTMRVLGHEGDVAHVRVRDNDGAYRGDTSCREHLPVLCLHKAQLPVPASVVPDAFSAQTGGAFYDGWTGGHLKLSAKTPGTALTSRAAADALCSNQHGAGYRMAEFHDGGGGWGFMGVGPLPNDAVFWVAISDQPANPWDFVAP